MTDLDIRLEPHRRRARAIRRAGLVAIAISVASILIAWLALAQSPRAGASRGDGDWACPDGTEHHYKIDDLDRPTFTVPSPPDGWVVTGVVVKAGPEHYVYAPVAPGQILDVKADVGHDVSHVHVCKARIPQPTTTVAQTTTTTEVPSSTIPATTTTTSTAPPATTTTVVASTSTSRPTSTVPATTSTSTTTAPPTPSSSPATTTTAPPSTSSSSPPSSSPPAITASPTLPATGPSDSTLLVSGLAALTVLSGLALLFVRRPR